MIVGVGTDVVDVARFEQSLERTHGMLGRLFTPGEQVLHSGAPRSVESLAARFAAKEALAKALGGGGMVWTDVEVLVADSGRPSFEISGTVAERVASLKVDRLHVSLTHDAGVASAVVIAEAD